MERANISLIEEEKVLHNVAAHLRNLAVDLSLVSRAVSGLTSHDAQIPSNETIYHLQKIDIILQSLNDLALLSEAIAHKTLHQKDVMEQVKLTSTRALLPSAVCLENDGNDSIELF